MACALLTSAAAGSGLETVFGSLLKVVLDVKKNSSMFEPTLKRLEDTLESITPSVRTIEAFNRDFDRPKEIEGLKKLLTRGEALVLKCSRVHKYNYFRKNSYTRKLVKLDVSIREYINTDLQMQQLADQKETLFVVRKLGAEVRKLSMEHTNVEFFNECDSMQDPLVVIPLQKFRKLVQRNEVPVPPTTLAFPVVESGRLCQESEANREFSNLFQGL